MSYSPRHHPLAQKALDSLVAKAKTPNATRLLDRNSFIKATAPSLCCFPRLLCMALYSIAYDIKGARRTTTSPGGIPRPPSQGSPLPPGSG